MLRQELRKSFNLFSYCSFQQHPNLTKKGEKKVNLFISHLIFFFISLGRLICMSNIHIVYELVTEKWKASKIAYLKIIHPFLFGAKDICNTYLLIYP